jgi:hypothetical protein
MRSRKNKYEEGTWFLVPLHNHGFVAGVVARASASIEGILLGYFFSDVYAQHPSLDDLCKLKPHDAREVIRFGDMGLRNGEWPIIGKCTDWSSKNWDVPNFVRIEPLSGRRHEVFYDLDDPAKQIGERELDVRESKDLKRDQLFGHIAVQRYMAHVLGYEVPALDIEKLRGNKSTRKGKQIEE